MKGGKKFNQVYFNQQIYLKNVNFPIKLTATDMPKHVGFLNKEIGMDRFLYLGNLWIWEEMHFSKR